MQYLIRKKAKTNVFFPLDSFTSILSCPKDDDMDEYANLNPEDGIRAENDFLKMKMMLERGAQFHSGHSADEMPPEIENIFLKNIMEFEKQYDTHKTIRIYDKIGQPAHFKPVAEIPDSDIDKEWDELLEHLHQYGICIEACSPKVTKRELYRFATEEFFQQEITDFNIPGMMHGFIYDEFYPDAEFECTKMSVDYCIRLILCKEPLQKMHAFRKNDLRLNRFYPLTEDEFRDHINSFKAQYKTIAKPVISDVICSLEEETCTVKGRYLFTATKPGEIIIMKGEWKVALERITDTDFWYIHNVQVQHLF